MGYGIVITGEKRTALQLERTCRRIGLEVAECVDPRLRPDVAKVVARALELGATGVHPGLIAPRARAELAKAVTDAGLLFVGPTVTDDSLLSDKLAMRAAADSAGVRVLAGSEGVVDATTALAEAERLGYPLLVKPVSGAGSIGIRLVDDPDDLGAAVAACIAEAEQVLEDGRVYLERAIPDARQVDVIVVADREGATTTLTEQESSLRSPVLVETPSPLLLSRGDGEAMREALWDAALRLADAMGLRGGMATFEFLLDADTHVYLTDCNANVCRSSLVLELTTRSVPIELEIELARGEPLGDPLRLAASGHAFAVTIEAGADRAGAMIEELRMPPVPHGKARIEMYAEPGSTLWDLPAPPIARIGVYAQVRHLALLALDRVLAESTIGPVPTNIGALRSILGHESFRAGQYHTGSGDPPLRATRAT